MSNSGAFHDHLHHLLEPALRPALFIQVLSQFLDFRLPQTQLKEGGDFFCVPHFAEDEQGAEPWMFLLPVGSHLLPQDFCDVRIRAGTCPLEAWDGSTLTSPLPEGRQFEELIRLLPK